MEMNETKIGRLEHKIEKLKTLGEQTPGVEFMRSEVFSGDHGLAVIEHAPFGVIGAITPVTHSLPTITGNAVSMIAGGNTVVVNPHPSGKKVAAEGVRRFNEAIYSDLGIDNLICVIAEPTLESANASVRPSRHQHDLRHRRPGRRPGRARIAASGRSSPARAIRRSSSMKRPTSINAARCDHSRRLRTTTTCSASPRRKCSSSPASSTQMMQAMERAGAVRLNAREVDALTKNAIVQVGEGEHKHDAPSKEFLGQDAAVLANGAGKSVSDKVELLFGETD